MIITKFIIHGDEFEYNGQKITVESNELLIAVKNK